MKDPESRSWGCTGCKAWSCRHHQGCYCRSPGSPPGLPSSKPLQFAPQFDSGQTRSKSHHNSPVLPYPPPPESTMSRLVRADLRARRKDDDRAAAICTYHVNLKNDAGLMSLAISLLSLQHPSRAASLNAFSSECHQHRDNSSSDTAICPGSGQPSFLSGSWKILWPLKVWTQDA